MRLPSSHMAAPLRHACRRVAHAQARGHVRTHAATFSAKCVHASRFWRRTSPIARKCANFFACRARVAMHRARATRAAGCALALAGPAWWRGGTCARMRPSAGGGDRDRYPEADRAAWGCWRGGAVGSSGAELDGAMAVCPSCLRRRHDVGPRVVRRPCRMRVPSQWRGCRTTASCAAMEAHPHMPQERPGSHGACACWACCALRRARPRLRAGRGPPSPPCRRRRSRTAGVARARTRSVPQRKNTAPRRGVLQTRG